MDDPADPADLIPAACPKPVSDRLFLYRKSGVLAGAASLEKGGEEYEETDIGTSLPEKIGGVKSSGMGIVSMGNGRFPR